MAETKLFPTQAAEEKIFLLIRKHWFNYLIFGFMAFLLLLPVAGIIFWLLANQGQISNELGVFLVILAAVITLSMLAIELYGFVNYYLDVYIVTDQRIVDISQFGLFNRYIAEVQIKQVQDVSAHVRGFFQTVLHFGDVDIQTAGERANFLFSSIPHPYSVSKQIIDLHENAVNEGEKIEVDKSYSEDELEKGYSLDEVEAEAKSIVGKKSSQPTPGVIIPKSNPAFIKKFEKSVETETSDLAEHELKEGEETKIEESRE